MLSDFGEGHPTQCCRGTKAQKNYMRAKRGGGGGIATQCNTALVIYLFEHCYFHQFNKNCTFHLFVSYIIINRFLDIEGGHLNQKQLDEKASLTLFE